MRRPSRAPRPTTYESYAPDLSVCFIPKSDMSLSAEDSNDKPVPAMFNRINLRFLFAFSGIFIEDCWKNFVDTALRLSRLEEVNFEFESAKAATTFVDTNISAMRKLRNAGKMGLWCIFYSSDDWTYHRLVFKVSTKFYSSML